MVKTLYNFAPYVNFMAVGIRRACMWYGTIALHCLYATIMTISGYLCLMCLPNAYDIDMVLFVTLVYDTIMVISLLFLCI